MADLVTIDPVLLRSPVVDPKSGLMTREWLRQQIQSQAGAQQANITAQILEQTGEGSGFDPFNPRDFAPQIQDALLSAAGDPARPYDDTELRAQLAGLDAPNLSFQQQLDELRAQLAAVDPPLPLANGATGTIAIPKITTSTGSITVVNGIIVAFVNPT